MNSVASSSESLTEISSSNTRSSAPMSHNVSIVSSVPVSIQISSVPNRNVISSNITSLRVLVSSSTSVSMSTISKGSEPYSESSLIYSSAGELTGFNSQPIPQSSLHIETSETIVESMQSSTLHQFGNTTVATRISDQQTQQRLTTTTNVDYLGITITIVVPCNPSTSSELIVLSVSAKTSAATQPPIYDVKSSSVNDAIETPEVGEKSATLTTSILGENYQITVTRQPIVTTGNKISTVASNVVQFSNSGIPENSTPTAIMFSPGSDNAGHHKTVGAFMTIFSILSYMAFF